MRTESAGISAPNVLISAPLSTGKADDVPKTADSALSRRTAAPVRRNILCCRRRISSLRRKRAVSRAFCVTPSSHRDGVCRRKKWIGCVTSSGRFGERPEFPYVSLSVCWRNQQFRKLKEAGVTRVHNNLETSRRFFPEVCTTHSFDDKIRAVRAAQAAGLSVCSGGIVGLGETVEDRIDMALTLRDLGIGSVPVNMLNPIPGTPLGERERLTEEEMRRIVAVYRFILPSASIRLAGGRGLLEDKGKELFYVWGECRHFGRYADDRRNHDENGYGDAERAWL